MRHRKAGRKLNRNASHRKAMFRNMTNALIENEVIKTTLPKAKELRKVAEPLITLAKNDSVANRRLAFSRLRVRSTVSKLFETVGPNLANRQGGYLRILKCGFRRGDAAPMAWVQLLDHSHKKEINQSESQILATDALLEKKDDQLSSELQSNENTEASSNTAELTSQNQVISESVNSESLSDSQLDVDESSSTESSNKILRE